MGWLAEGVKPGGIIAHQCAKEVMSSEACRPEREAARLEFEQMATSDPFARAILDMEAAAAEVTPERVVEPLSIPCRIRLLPPIAE